MGNYDERNCNERHCNINGRFEKGEARMNAHETSLNDHETRIAIAETIAKRQTSLFWNLISPALSFFGAVAAGIILAWFLKSG